MLTTTVANIKNNAAFDLNVLEAAIEDIKLSSFTNLYNFQKDLTGIQRFDLTMNQLVPMTNISGQTRIFTKKYIGFVKADFIHKSKRLTYKRSAFYNKELSIFDVASNSNIFSYSYMVFVNGQFVDSINILPKDDRTAIIMDIQDPINPVGIPQTHFDTLRASNAKITVFFIPNAMYGTYNTTRADLLKHKDQLALSELNIAGSLTTDSNYITFVNNQKLLFGSVATDTTNSANMLRFTSNSGLAVTNKKIHLNVFGFRHLYKQLQVPGTDKFFRIDGLDMPVPVENMMVFRNDGNNLKTFAHDITIKQYYPNIYEVIGNTTNNALTIYTFYSKDTITNNLELANELSAYERFKGTSLTPYVNNSVPDIIKNYTPQTINYSIDDFNKSAQFPDHLAYKLNKLSAWVDNDPELLKRYLLRQLKSQEGYYIKAADINLASKLRTNNHSEITNTADRETFTNNRYVFIIKNDPAEDFNSFRFYIDGNAYVPDKRWREGIYEVFYLPQTLIKSDSIIEIERFKKFSYFTTVSFSSTSENEQVQVNLTDLTPQDIFLVDTTNQNIVDKSKYTVSYFANGVKTALPETSFKVILDGKFVINMKDTGLLNRNIQIRIQRDTYYHYEQVTEVPEVGETFIFDKAVNPDRRHYRIFRNGRLLSQNLYEIEPTKTFGGQNLVTPLVYKEIGDEYIIDYTPNKYKVVYEQTSVSTNGFLDLRGKIDKPFDFKWYDLYINGRRMTVNHVDFISPFLLVLKNISSLKNVLIVERDKDTDFIKPAVGAKTLTEKIWDSLPDFQTSVFTGRPTIPNTEPDVISEVITERSLELLRFRNQYVSQVTFIDSDTLQLTAQAKTDYPPLFIGNVFSVNPDTDYNARSYVMKLFND